MEHDLEIRKKKTASWSAIPQGVLCPSFSRLAKQNVKDGSTIMCCEAGELEARDSSGEDIAEPHVGAKVIFSRRLPSFLPVSLRKLLGILVPANAS